MHEGFQKHVYIHDDSLETQAHEKEPMHVEEASGNSIILEEKVLEGTKEDHEEKHVQEESLKDVGLCGNNAHFLPQFL